MYMSTDSEEIQQDDFYQVACIHCGETIFKLSQSTLAKIDTASLRCPKCNKETLARMTGYYRNILEITTV